MPELIEEEPRVTELVGGLPASTDPLPTTKDEGVSPLERYDSSDIEYSRAYQRNPRATFPSTQRYIGDTESGSDVQVLVSLVP